MSIPSGGTYYAPVFFAKLCNTLGIHKGTSPDLEAHYLEGQANTIRCETPETRRWASPAGTSGL